MYVFLYMFARYIVVVNGGVGCSAERSSPRSKYGIGFETRFSGGVVLTGRRGGESELALSFFALAAGNSPFVSC